MIEVSIYHFFISWIAIYASGAFFLSKKISNEYDFMVFNMIWAFANFFFTPVAILAIAGVLYDIGLIH